jgi:hypothetical protein
MSFAAVSLAWSAVDAPDGYLKSGQMDELLEGLVHVNRYFRKCVLNPTAATRPPSCASSSARAGGEGVPEPSGKRCGRRPRSPT